MTEWGPGLAILLGLVEGLTEFLPVSSTGHLILVGYWLGFTGAVAISVEISIQLGSILAIVAYERHKLAAMLSNAWKEQASFRALVRTSRESADRNMEEGLGYILWRSADQHPNLWFLTGLSLAFLPAAVMGLLARHWIEAYLFSPRTVAASLIVGGLIILAVEAFKSRPQINRLEQVGAKAALWVGLAQCVSLIPGVSRSGATIVGGLLTGMDRKIATEYSFFLALPTMIAATSYKMFKSRDLLTSQDALALVLGLLVSFFVAWGVIAAFLAFVKQHSLRAFAYYRVALGILVLLVLG
ncbi:MAG: undecaprenyl-diphosphate phosphatase [Nitrospirae bacterium]|nr:MAG: undecaprenyl-diphosphate phosphatase [Nitrospirota bacterium]